MITLTKNRKFALALIVIFLILGGVFILGTPNAKAGFLDAITKPGQFVMNILAWLAYGILWVFSRMINLAAYLLDSVFQIERFTDVPIVTEGWKITRGLCNMFFALILLAMAFDTILQIGKFPINKTLPRLIIVALLINFSLMFCGIIIDFAQILTHYFIDAAKGNSTIGDQLANGLNITQVFNMPVNIQTANEATLQAQLGGETPSLLTLFGSFIFGIIIILIATFALAAGAIFMLIRMVSLWILLITAPLAWVSMIVPGAPGIGDIAGKWWNKFFQWTFFAPTYAFFIYLAVLAAAPGANNISAIVRGTQTAAQEQITSGIFTNNFLSGGIYMLLQYIVIIVILIYGLQSAQNAGLYGAGKIIGWGKSLKKGAGSLAGVGGHFVERWAAKGAEEKGAGAWSRTRRAMSYLAPTPWKEAWKKRSAQKDREAFPVATGARQDLLNRILPGWEKTDYRERAIRQREADERKDITSTNAEELVKQFTLAEQKGNASKMGAYTQALANQNDLNELFRELQKKFKDLDFSMSAEGLINLVDRVLAPKMGQSQANRLGHDLARVLEGKGQWLGRPFNYNPKTSQYEKVSNVDSQTGKPMQRFDGTEVTVADVARSNATGEWSKMDPQPQVFTTGRFSYFKESYDKETGATIKLELTDDGKRKLSTLSPDHANRWHMQTKLITMFKYPDELKRLNEELYKRAINTMATSTKGMSSSQLKNYIDYNAQSVPSVTPEEKERLIKLITEQQT